ncbi:MAG: aminotransferase class I/II-fold pyridoxal phosphate-dependent enzyme [Bacteroidia bacterium]
MENLSHILFQAGENREDYFMSVAPPIMQSSNFCFNTVDQMRDGLAREYDAPFYTRGYNPTVAILREKLALLEECDDSLVCSSGSAAVAIALTGFLKAGDHVICVQKPYSWTYKMLNELLSRFGVETSFIDGTNISNFNEALRENTRVVFLESPNSMTFEMQDLRAVAEFCAKHNLISIIDNSYSSPLFQKPALMGIDIIVHSSTKFINGHSDVVCGVICGSKIHIRQLFSHEWMTLGSIISPHDAWLMIRGLRTLELRVGRSASTAEFIYKGIKNHPAVAAIYYPFAENNPQIELARRQMSRCAGMFSIVLKGKSFKPAEVFSNALKNFLMAASWGGYESLAFPVCAFSKMPWFSDSVLPPNMVRMYFGLEDPELLLADVNQALDEALKYVD